MNLSRMKTAQEIETLKKHPRIFELEKLPPHIQTMFEGKEPMDRFKTDVHTYDRFRSQFVYVVENLEPPHSPCRLRAKIVNNRMGKYGHLNNLYPVSLKKAQEPRIPDVGCGKGLDGLKGAPVYSGDKKTYELTRKPMAKFVDVCESQGYLQLFVVSQKALDIIQDHVEASAISVSEPIIYEDVDIVPDETFYLIDVVKFHDIIDLPDSHCGWDFVWGAPGLVEAAKLPWDASRTSLLPGAEVDIARDRHCTDRIYCGRHLIEAFRAEKVTGIDQESF